jgi:MFS transporter, PAT family, beta-lactamase induction signal transducer AmpG
VGRSLLDRRGVYADWSRCPARTLKQAITGPFTEFFTRNNARSAVLLLTFLVLYKLGDNLATTLLTPFYIDLGFTLTEIGTVVKLTSLWSTIAGSLVGGLVIARIGINRSLWIFGFVQLLSILGFAGLAEVGRHLGVLVGAVIFEYLGVGLGTSAFVAFIARATSKRFSATQYALFSSLVALPGIVTGALAGVVIEAVGYTQFFLICTALGVPGMLLLFKVAPWGAGDEATPAA